MEKTLEFDIQANGLNTSLLFPVTIDQLPGVPSANDKMEIGPLPGGSSAIIDWSWVYSDNNISINGDQNAVLSFKMDYLLIPIPSALGNDHLITFDMLGRDTIVDVNSTGVVQETVQASDPTDLDHIDIYQGTRIITTNGSVPSGLVLSSVTNGTYPSAPIGTVEIGNKYLLSGFNGRYPAEVLFLDVAGLTISFDRNQFPSGYDRSMIFQLATDGNWTEMIGWTGVSSSSWEARGDIDSTGLYVVAAANDSFGSTAFISSSSLVVSPSVVDYWSPLTIYRSTGGSVMVSVVLTNTGDSDGTDDVSLMIDGGTYDSLLVDIPAGESRQVTMNATGIAEGDHVIWVAGIEGGLYTESYVNWPLIFLMIFICGIITLVLVRRVGPERRTIHDVFIKELNIKVVRPPKSGGLGKKMRIGGHRRITVAAQKDYEERVIREIGDLGITFNDLVQVTSIPEDRLLTVLEELYLDKRVQVRPQEGTMLFIRPSSDLDGQEKKGPSKE